MSYSFSHHEYKKSLFMSLILTYFGCLYRMFTLIVSTTCSADFMGFILLRYLLVTFES